MKKILILLVFGLIGIMSQAQTVKISDDMATVDGVEYVRVSKIGMGNEMSIFGLDSEKEEIFISRHEYNDPTKANKGNPDGRVSWIEINFLTLDLKCEVDNRTNKALIKLLYQNNIYINGAFSEDNAKTMASKYGTKFSENRPNNGTVNININVE